MVGVALEGGRIGSEGITTKVEVKLKRGGLAKKEEQQLMQLWGSW